MPLDHAKAGRSRSPSKQATARANGCLGGRPRKAYTISPEMQALHACSQRITALWRRRRDLQRRIRENEKAIRATMEEGRAIREKMNPIVKEAWDL